MSNTVPQSRYQKKSPLQEGEEVITNLPGGLFNQSITQLLLLLLPWQLNLTTLT